VNWLKASRIRLNRRCRTSDFDDVVKTAIYLVDLNDFIEVNDVYAAYFKDEPPARSTVQVAALPKGALVEIDMVAYVGER
jgi:2-iminobutanoate/2-iminopropanoate deaminase